MSSFSTDLKSIRAETFAAKTERNCDYPNMHAVQAFCEGYETNYIQSFQKTELMQFQNPVPRSTWLSLCLSTLHQARVNKRNVFLIGNGASCSMASHFATDLTKNGKMSAHSINEGALLTCFANDYSFESMYENIVRCKMADNDVLVAISSSGCSVNIVRAAQYVRDQHPNATVLTFTGFSKDNALIRTGHLNLWVPYGDYGIVESVHAYFLQLLVDAFTMCNQNFSTMAHLS